MIPYGIVIRQNKIVMQQSLILWQKKYGLLRPGKFIASAIPFISAFIVILSAAVMLFQKSVSPVTAIGGVIFNTGIIALMMYFTAMKTVREYAATTREENIQLVLTEDALEITTEFSKEIIPYGEIELCYEKNFLLTIITDKNAFPISVSKMHFLKGNYDTFVSLLKAMLPDRYEKRGEN